MTATVAARWEQPVQAWLRFLAADGRPASSVTVRRTQITQFARAMHRRDPWEVTTEQIVDWMAANPNWSISYRRALRAAVRGYYSWAVETGLTTANPAARLPTIRPEMPLPRPAPDHVVRAALEVVPLRELIMISLGRDCGLRRAEIASVHTDDIRIIRSEVMLHVRGKGRRDRLVPVPDYLAGVLLARQSGWLFPSPVREDQPLTPAHVGKLVSRALAGPWTTHTLRHAFATAAFAVEGDLFAVRDLLGHASIATTENYVLSPRDSMIRAARGAQLPPPPLPSTRRRFETTRLSAVS